MLRNQLNKPSKKVQIIFQKSGEPIKQVCKVKKINRNRKLWQKTERVETQFPIPENEKHIITALKLGNCNSKEQIHEKLSQITCLCTQAISKLKKHALNILSGKYSCPPKCTKIKFLSRISEQKTTNEMQIKWEKEFKKIANETTQEVIRKSIYQEDKNKKKLLAVHMQLSSAIKSINVKHKSFLSKCMDGSIKFEEYCDERKKILSCENTKKYVKLALKSFLFPGPVAIEKITSDTSSIRLKYINKSFIILASIFNEYKGLSNILNEEEEKIKNKILSGEFKDLAELKSLIAVLKTRKNKCLLVKLRRRGLKILEKNANSNN